MSATADSESSGACTVGNMISNIDKSYTTQSRAIFLSTLRMLRSTGEHSNYVDASNDEKTTYAKQVEIIVHYLKKYKLMPFHKTDKREFGKDRKESLDLRNKGNRRYMKQNEEAMLFYSRSIAAAPYPIGKERSEDEDSEELAVAFANRSAVYFVMKKYEACLKDIDQALKLHWPDKLKPKILERRAKCYQALGKKDPKAGAQDATSTATNLPEEGVSSTTDALTRLQLGTGSVQHDSSEESKQFPQKAFGQHNDIPCASECVDVAYNPEVGRHIVVNRDVDPGAVLFVEEPFAALLEPKYAFSHCNHCLKRSDAMIPCIKCDQVMYCSEVCRGEAWELYHRVECRILPALGRLDVGSEDSGNLLALRLFLVACSRSNGIVGLYNLAEKLDQTTSYKNNINGFNEDGKYLSSDYEQIHYLHGYNRSEPNAKLTAALVAACCLNCLLEYTDFFTDTKESNVPVEKLISFTGGLIYKFIQVIWTNAFTVVDYESTHVAAGIYSTLSLLNHSCNATSCRVVRSGATRVIVARMPIRKGEEVSTTYVEYFDNMNANIRKMKLNTTYGFNCRCIACVNNWPEFDGLATLASPTFICKTCRIPLPKKSLKLKNQVANCTECNNKFDLSQMYKEAIEIDKRLKHISIIYSTMSVPDLMGEATRLIKAVDSILLSPNQLMSYCHELLALVVKREF